MTAITWNDAYAIGIPEIDIQHKKLISIIGELYEARQIGTGQIMIQETLDKLIDYTNYHSQWNKRCIRNINILRPSNRERNIGNLYPNLTNLN